jgi:hypothetical protein
MGHKICSGPVACVAMRRFGVAITIALALHQLQAASSLTLQVYCVSSEPKPGWRYFNTSAFPQLGYVAPEPDMLISRLKSVSIQKSVEHRTTVQPDGSRDSQQNQMPSLVVEFTPEDACKLQQLTATHLGQRLLWLLGNEELFAPVIRMAIEGSSVSITLRPEIDPEILKAQLEKLIE